MTTFADLSHHQARVDLAVYAAAGHDRIALKATEGLDFTDPTFADRWRRAGELGLARVAYHFARAAENGAAEFDRLLAVVTAAGGMTGRDALCLDTEDERTPARAAENAIEFCRRAVARGVPAGLVYSGVWYLRPATILAASLPAGWRQLWLSDYTVGQADGDVEMPPGWSRTQLAARQFTSSGTVAGIAGLADYSRVLNDWLTTEGPDDMTPEQTADLFTQLADLKAAINLVLYGDKRGPGDAGTHPENIENIVDKLNALTNKVNALSPGTGSTTAYYTLTFTPKSL